MGNDLRIDRRYMVGARFRKDFGEHGVFEGRVIGREGNYYQIEYEDGDREEMDETDLGEVIELPAEAKTNMTRRRLPNCGEDNGKRMVSMGNRIRELASGTARSSGSSFVTAAQDRLSTGLGMRTVSKYRTAMKHFKVFLFVESLDWSAVGVMTNGGGREPSVLSNQNETLMMGFGEYLVTEVRVQVRSAKQYVTNVRTQLSTNTGYDPSYGVE